MTSCNQQDQWLDKASLDAIFSMPSQASFDFGPLSNTFNGLATPPADEEPGDFIQRLASQV